MMNRQWILLLLCLMYKATAFSAPVFPKAVSVRQPDGSRLTIICHGDEFCHYMTTADGYTIVKGTDGYYRYATLIDGQLMATPAKASDVSGRNKAENLFLQTMRKGIAPEMSPQAKRLKEGMLHQTGLLQQLRPNKRNSSASLQKAGISHDYRGLVLLVNFSDHNFSRGRASMAMKTHGPSATSDPVRDRCVTISATTATDSSNQNLTW